MDCGRADHLRLAVTSYYLPSESKIGAGWMSHRLANALADRGHEVTMFSPSSRPGDARYEHRHVPITGSARTFRWGWVMRNLDLGGFDGLLAQGDDHFVRRGAVPAHVRTLHGSCFDEAVHIRGAVNRARMLALGATELVAAVRTPEVVGVSKASLRFFPWRHTVVPNGVDIELFAPDPLVPKEPTPTVLFVGTDGNRKRGWLLRKVFEQHVLPRLPEARLWMVCEDAPASPGVEVLGRLSDAELADRYRRAWVFCLPSTYEGFGVPYIEALVSGTAVIATPNRGAREVLGGGVGVVVDESRLGPELARLLTDGAYRRSYEQAGLAQRSTYDIGVIADTYCRLISAQLARTTTD